jgi:kynurenine formamidase
MKSMFACVLGAALGLCVAARAGAEILDLARCEIVDLTHSFNSQTLYWPTSPSSFKLERLAYGATEGGYFYAANSFCTPEHGGTHLDAPIHFSATGLTVDRVALQQLVAPLRVIDVADSAERNPDYRLTAADVAAFERRRGRIPAGSIVVLRTGWEKRWPDRKAYFGDDTPGDASRLHFPSFGVEAARILVEQRGVAAIGLDTPSIDYGQSRDFLVHRLAAARNVPGLENLMNLDRLPATGALMIALPVKIEGGSGGPVRAIALVPRGRGR